MNCYARQNYYDVSLIYFVTIAITVGVAVLPFLTPIGGIIVGGVIEFGFGAVGAIGGEWLTEEAIRIIDR